MSCGCPIGLVSGNQKKSPQHFDHWVAALQADLLQFKKHPSRLDFSPEPVGQLGAGGFSRLGGGGFEIVGLQVLARQFQSVSDGYSGLGTRSARIMEEGEQEFRCLRDFQTAQSHGSSPLFSNRQIIPGLEECNFFFQDLQGTSITRAQSFIFGIFGGLRGRPIR